MAAKATRASKKDDMIRSSKSAPARSSEGQAPSDALLRDVALLAAANNIMAQTAFLAVERLRISSEIVDESVSDDFGAKLFQRCERLVQASDAAILRLLEHSRADEETRVLIEDLIRMRGEFAQRGQRPPEQSRLVESMERMYR